MPSLGRVISGLAVLLMAAGGAGAASAASDPGALVLKNTCSACHAPVTGGGYERITQIRKTPEGWQITLNRMALVHDLKLSDTDYAAVLKYLADHYGLAPSETTPYRAFLEREPSVQDEVPNPFLREVCSRCHTFARIGLERRDTAEWVKLSNFHLGQYPATEYSEKGRDREWWKLASETAPPMLGKMYPFTTPAWTEWQKRANPDLAGTWRVTGHTPGRGDYQGRMFVEATTADHYKAALDLTYADGGKVEGKGQAIVYTGYEWRATFALGQDKVEEVAEVGADGGIRGRWFMADRPERGGSLTAYRESGAARILTVSQPYLRAGQTAEIEIDGVNLSGAPQLGTGVSVLGVVSHSPERIMVRVKADANAADGPRTVSVGTAKADGALVVYRKIGFVKVIPADTIARVGGNGGPIPPVSAQFEAVGYLPAPNGDKTKAVRIGVFPAKWVVSGYDAEAKARKDEVFTGHISQNGEFEPAGAGPNPKRKFSGNNVGSLRVTATVPDGGETISGDAHLIVTVQRWITEPIL